MSEVTPVSQQRWKCLCAYDGSGFDGWQSQAGGTAIQDTIEARLAAIFGRPIRIHASGRTDAGVHALGQVFHFDADWRHGPDKLLVALGAGLPRAIQIRSMRPVGPAFHARFSVKRKRYVYRLHLGDADPFTRPFCWSVFKPLDIERMRGAAGVLRGEQDFRALTASNGSEREDTVRHLRRLDVIRRGRRVDVIAEADGFLYKMVRSIVGVLVAVGEGRLSSAELRRIVASRQRTPAVHTAPPHGLFLARVFYR